MPNWKRKREAQQQAPKPLIQDYPYESLESITADLPGEDEALWPEEDQPSAENTEKASDSRRGETGADAPKTDHRQKEGNAFQRMRARFQELEEEDEEDELPHGLSATHPVLRNVLLITFTVLIAGLLGVMLLSNFLGAEFRTVPEEGVSRVVTPIQNVFSTITESIADYFRTLKLRANLEEAYLELVAENERLTYENLQVQEYQYQLSQYEGMSDEIAANQAMQPIVCSVIGRSDGNYFSTFTINRGTSDGVAQYMAVTIHGALVGYTEVVKAHESTVRTIIDSEASIAGLIRSSRDQGTVRGTLGVDGTAMCRMYYLPDDHLPRPGDVVVTSGVGMSFPKGIPIGTVRESTRGMESNKQYIVVEPTADFQHLEYVIVLRYQPTPEAVQGRTEGASNVSYVPLETARPYPTLRMGSLNYFGVTATPGPAESGAIATITPAPASTPEPYQTLAPLVAITPAPTSEMIEYIPVDGSPTPTPTPEPTPTPTPLITLGPENMTLEED